MNKLHIFKNALGNYAWHVKASNGRILYGATDGDGFRTKRAVVRNLAASFCRHPNIIRKFLRSGAAFVGESLLQPEHSLKF